MSTPSAQYQPPTNTSDLVLAWLRRARESQMSHYEMANILGHRGQWIGVPVILITAVVGTSVFASVATEVIPVQAKVVVGLLSVLAAVLSSLQTFFKFSERAEKHRSFAARFGAIRRELETVYAGGGTPTDAHHLGVLREKLDRLADEAPHVPGRVFLEVQRKLPQLGETSNTLMQPTGSKPSVADRAR